jgi:PAT family beta-lactamase induction signal transducer AmpG
VSLENISGGMVGAVFVALLMSLCNPRFSATQYALLSGIYALSRSILAAPAGFDLVAQPMGETKAPNTTTPQRLDELLWCLVVVLIVARGGC